MKTRRTRAQRRLSKATTRRFKRQREMKRTNPELHDQVVAYLQDSFFRITHEEIEKFHK